VEHDVGLRGVFAGCETLVNGGVLMNDGGWRDH